MRVKDFINKAAASFQFPPEESERKSICKWLLIDKYSIKPNSIALNEELSINEAEYFADLALINKGVPLQQLVGFTFFADCKIKVNQSVLIPRPETEELVYLMASKLNKPAAILDICSGSGCIALAMKKLFPQSTVTGWELSEQAIAIAKINAAENNLEINWEQKDALSLAKEHKVKFDLVISNPPYIKHVEKAEMSKTVINYEPHLALFVPDEDPMLFYRSITAFAVDSLKNGGYLAFEINKSHGDDVAAILQDHNFGAIEVLNDMSELPRFVIGKR